MSLVVIKQVLTLSRRVLEEDLHAVNVLSAWERISSDTEDEGLTQANVGGLRDSLVCKGTRARDNTNFPWLVDVAGLNAHLATQWVDDSGAVRAHKSRFRLAI